ncbi:MAG: rhodanese-like domain-containing protein [Ideonella sp.]|nr:rhodanese-like domain-containing protein [Ideonella sp.]
MPPSPGHAVSRRAVVALAGVFALALAGGARAAGNPDSVDLVTARTESAAGRAILIDIREPDEHARGVAAGARLLPMRQLAQRLGEIPTDPRQPVLLICNTQNRSRATLRALRERGYPHVRYVEGGMSEWVQRGWPVVPPAR